MKYSVIKCINGTFSIDSEWSDLTKAKVSYHDVCKAMWNATDVITAKVMVADEQLNCVDNCREYVYHEPEPEPETEGTEVTSEETE